MGTGVADILGSIMFVADATSSDQHRRGLRLRRCCDTRCNVVFTICASCDRGQRYCSEPCRKRTRQQQLHDAGRRYQATATGKAKHCERQQAYRQRRSRASVTHQRFVATNSKRLHIVNLARCAVCGRHNPWINPFYWGSNRRRLIKKTRF